MVEGVAFEQRFEQGPGVELASWSVPGLVEPMWLKVLQVGAETLARAMMNQKNYWGLLESERQMMSGERKSLAVENETNTVEAAVVLDIEAVGTDFEVDMKFAIGVERVRMAFGTAGKESVARPGVSDSADKAFVKEHTEPGQGEKKFEAELGIVAEKKGILLGLGVELPVQAIVGRSGASEDEVVAVVSPTVDICSAAEIEGTAAYTVAVVVAAVDNNQDCGP